MMNDRNSEGWLRLCLDGATVGLVSASELESRLASTPDDVMSRVKLIGYYFAQPDPSLRQRRVPHVIWMIANRPEIDLRRFAELSPEEDPLSYQQGVDAWLLHATTLPYSPSVLRRAVSYCLWGSLSNAEDLIRQGMGEEPNLPEWRLLLAETHIAQARKESSQEHVAVLYKKAMDEFDAATAMEPDIARRCRILLAMAKASLSFKEYERAETAAAECISLTASDPTNYSYEIHHARIVLGKVALVRGDVPNACKQLLDSIEIVGSPSLSSFGPDLRLATGLLEKGERRVVLDYLNACKRLWVDKLPLIDKWIEGIKSGEVPSLLPWDSRTT